jgi:hypothetical protein
MRQLPLPVAITRGRLFNMIIKSKAFTLVDTRSLDNIKLSVCGIGLLAHISRWTDDNLNTAEILDEIYDMCHHDKCAAVGYIELLEENIIHNFFQEDEMDSIKSLAKR